MPHENPALDRISKMCCSPGCIVAYVMSTPTALTVSALIAFHVFPSPAKNSRKVNSWMQKEWPGNLGIFVGKNIVTHILSFSCVTLYIYIYMHMIFSPCIYDHWLLLELWEVLSKGHHENHPNEGLDWFGCDAAKK